MLYIFISFTDQSSHRQFENNVQGSCCCTCCMGSEINCGTCTGPNATDAAHCAATKAPMSPPPNTTPPPPSSTTTADPMPVPGSQFPERILPREDFQQEEKLTEILANMDHEEKQDLGYTSNELILECQYSGYTCDIR